MECEVCAFFGCPGVDPWWQLTTRSGVGRSPRRWLVCNDCCAELLTMSGADAERLP
jgi:hypothetical protein